MFNKDNQRFFLPLWREGRLLFFTNYSEKAAMRQSYIVAAATEAGQSEVARTQLASVNAEELEKCQSIADNGPVLQQFFDAIGGGNLTRFSSQFDENSTFFIDQSDRLIYICLYLDLLRKYAIDETIVRNYETATPSAPLNAEVSHGVLKILSGRLEPERGSALFDRDLEIYEKSPYSNLAAANFLRAGAMAKSESGNTQDAEKIMLRAVKVKNSEDKWRRLGEFARANGKDEAAIEYYNTAHALSPLPPPSALIMANLLLKTGKLDQLEPFLELTAKAFPKAAEAIRQKIPST